MITTCQRRLVSNLHVPILTSSVIEVERTPYSAVSDLDLHCLQIPLLIEF